MDSLFCRIKYHFYHIFLEIGAKIIDQIQHFKEIFDEMKRKMEFLERSRISGVSCTKPIKIYKNRLIFNK